MEYIIACIKSNAYSLEGWKYTILSKPSKLYVNGWYSGMPKLMVLGVISFFSLMDLVNDQVTLSWMFSYNGYFEVKLFVTLPYNELANTYLQMH